MKRKTIVSLMLTLIIIGGVFGFLTWRQNKLRNQCRNQLRLLYLAMECCMPMDLGLTNGAPLDPTILATYVGQKIPKCPRGPEYEVVWVVGGPPPKCPYHGDLLTAVSNISVHNVTPQL